MVVVCGLLAAGEMQGQDAKKAATDGTGSITGHVYLSDTNAPARFARVMLKPAATAETVAAAQKKSAEMMDAFKDIGGKKNGDSADDAKERQTALTSIMSSLGDMNLSGVVSADGSYSLTGVKPGTYYLHAVVAGYVDPLRGISSADLSNPDPAVQKRIADAVTTVTVTADVPAHQDLRLERGAAISGHVMFDDGSPAAGWTMSVLHRQDAAVVTLTAGEERGDETLVMPLSKMHSISGLVQAKTDAHVINSGTVALVEDGGGPGAILRAQSATVQDDGTFRFDYIANGHYVLKIKMASIEVGNGKTSSLFGMDMPDSDTVRSFANAEQKVDVEDADVNGVVFSLADEPVEKKQGKGKK
jgi:hypothetical protein